MAVSTTSLRTGDIVRVVDSRTGGGGFAVFQGVVRAASTDSVTIVGDTGSVFRLTRADGLEVQRRAGVRGVRAVATGLAVGVVAGAILGGIASSVAKESNANCDVILGCGPDARREGSGGRAITVGGAVAGTVIGVLFAPTAKWQRVLWP